MIGRSEESWLPDEIPHHCAMPEVPENRLRRTRSVLLVMSWVLLVFMALSGYAFWEQRRLQVLLLEQAAILHRQASQRADQHDAHLTALSAVAVKDGMGRKDLFLEVAAAIRSFYPRIRAIDLVSLSDATAITTRPAADSETNGVIREAVRASGGKLVLRTQSQAAGTYLLVKRSPNTSAALYGLALEVDAGMLVRTESAFWDRPSARYSLWLDGEMLGGASLEGAPQFDKVLGSASQPLVLKAAISPRLHELFTPRAVIALSAAATLLHASMLLGLRQIARTRAAERAARLHAQDARLAHASRVNALGEMASGMAHELAQPLSAILSQVQAGKRLATRGDFDRLGQILADSELQTKRAAAILDRLRHWIQPGETVLGEISVNQAVENVEVLLRAEAARTGVEISHELAPGLPSVLGNAVELEQVIFNLVRNAMEAVSRVETRRVMILTEALNGSVRLSVSDTGPGIPKPLRDRLFDPFVTGKPGGTGLGLTLCQRLVERMGGEITLDDGADMTRFHVILPAASK